MPLLAAADPIKARASDAAQRQELFKTACSEAAARGESPPDYVAFMQSLTADSPAPAEASIDVPEPAPTAPREPAPTPVTKDAAQANLMEPAGSPDAYLDALARASSKKAHLEGRDIDKVDRDCSWVSTNGFILH